MNGYAIRNWLMAWAVGLCAAGGAFAMGDKLPADADAPARWSRPGDEIATERGEAVDPVAAQAADPDAPEVFFDAEGSPADWRWKARLVVVFANTPQDPAFVEQISALERGTDALIDRDAVVIVDPDPEAESGWRRALRPEGFSLVLIDKDGTVMLRKPVPWDMREISRAIDRFPQRRQELRGGQ